MPRFVILEHDWPTRHWDLLLEQGDVLKAWRLLAEPGMDRTVPAEPNFDHRLLYLDYEGPLSGNRGTVHRWDAGAYDGEPGPEGGAIRLSGGRLQGSAHLRRGESGWLFDCCSEP